MNANLEYLRRKPAEEAAFKGSILLGHAVYTTHSYFQQPSRKSLSDYLSKNGFHVVAFDDMDGNLGKVSRSGDSMGRCRIPEAHPIGKGKSRRDEN